ncbi:hypothetical protein [Zoogloea sp.]|uniref:hypothetical protein n=1 Tax=Zoogloea sp. TaxID=49181 RepID=UPI0035AE8704
MKKIDFGVGAFSDVESRIGGGALIDGVVEWPVWSETGRPLTLVASLRAGDIFGPAVTGYISIFSYYDKNDYFLDSIVYHGDSSELNLIRSGSTRVVIHPQGGLCFSEITIPPVKIDFSSVDCMGRQGSGWGGSPGLLQEERLDLRNFDFLLQLYSADFPEPFGDVFGCPDAVGYVFISHDFSTGLFFVQAT